MRVCFAVWRAWSRTSFLVTPLPERLRGGNTASGCPCPSLFLSLFLSCSLSLLCSLLCLTFPRPHPSLPISVCLCCFLRSERCCGAGLPPSNKAEFFHPCFCLCSSLSFLSVSPPALFLHFCPPFLTVFIPIQASKPPPHPPYPHLSATPTSLLLLMAARVRVKQLKCPPRRRTLYSQSTPSAKTGGKNK